MKKIRRILVLIITVSVLAVNVSCKKEITAEDLMVNIESVNASESSIEDDFCKKYSSAAFTMLKNEFQENEGNIVISPLGAYCNIAMLANGASDPANSEIQKIFGNSYDCGEVNVLMHSYMEDIKSSDNAKLYFENAMWFNSDKNAAPTNDFLTTAKTYYDASAYREPFGYSAARNINHWASNMTDMTAEHILSDIPEEHPLSLVNVTSLNADWDAPISPENVFDGSFTNAKAQEEKAQIMSSYEYIYVGNDMVQGFMKKYAGGNYAFLALLPRYDQKNALRDTVQYFTNGSHYYDVVNSHKNRVIDASIPKFSCEYKGSIRKMLEKVNLGSCFSPSYSDLSHLGTADGGMYVGDLYVKTGLSVTERGTSKGTGAKAGDSSVATNVITITLNRPFIFAVVDTKNYMPVILGVINTLKG